MSRKWQFLLLLVAVLLLVLVSWWWPILTIECHFSSNQPCPEAVQAKLKYQGRYSFWWVGVETELATKLRQQGYTLVRWEKRLPGTVALVVAEPSYRYQLQSGELVRVVSEEGLVFDVGAQSSLTAPKIGVPSLEAITSGDGAQVVPSVHQFLSAFAQGVELTHLLFSQATLINATEMQVVVALGDRELRTQLDASDTVVQLQRLKMIVTQPDMLPAKPQHLDIDLRFKLPVIKEARQVEQAPMTQTATPSATAKPTTEQPVATSSSSRLN